MTGTAIAPRADAPGAVWPLATDAPFTFGQGLGAPRNGHAHRGLDIPARTGTPIRATRGGRVVRSTYGQGPQPGEGHYVVVRDAEGLDWTYAHMHRAPDVRQGETVATGDMLGVVGSTGASTGPHLHIGVRRGRTVLDVEPLMRALAPSRGVVGDDVRIGIVSLANRVRDFRFPEHVQRMHDDDDGRELRDLRLLASVRDNVREGLTIATRALDAGNASGAQNILRRAQERWSRWLRQVGAIDAEDEAQIQRDNRSFLDEYDDWMRERERDARNLFNSATSSSTLGWLAVGAAVAWALFGGRR